MKPVNTKTVLNMEVSDLVALIAVVLVVLVINTIMWIILF